MDEIIHEFKLESKSLTEQLVSLLESTEEGCDHRQQLEEFGQIVDRIMGGAKTLALTLPESKASSKIGKYAELCKLVGYKGSQIENNPAFVGVVVGLLFDATEMLDEMIGVFGTKEEADIDEVLTDTFLDRLAWVDTQFAENVRGTVAMKNQSKGNGESEIADILSELGLKIK